MTKDKVIRMKFDERKRIPRIRSRKERGITYVENIQAYSNQADGSRRHFKSYRNYQTHLDETIICQHLPDVTADISAWVFLREPGFIGFGVVQSDKIYLPPYPDTPRDWTQVRDLCLFGEKGEWRVQLFTSRNGYQIQQCWLVEFDDKGWSHLWLGWEESGPFSTELDDIVIAYDTLCGTRMEFTDTPPWVKLVEDRGAEIWLPLGGSALTEKDLPLQLKLQTHVANDIRDGSYEALVRGSDNSVIPPRLFISCT